MKFVILLSIVSLAICADPPEHWKEHWFEHNQDLTRVHVDDNLAVYYDSHMDRSITWPFKLMSDVWAYTKKTYGQNYGPDPRLYAIFHQGTYSGGHPSVYFDGSHDYRNVIDVGLGDWKGESGQQITIPVHEVAHIVEGATKGVHNSPAFGIWHDSKWAEIYIYDTLRGIGRQSVADQLKNEWMNGKDDFPRANTHWFKDWFYPIYEHGASQALNGYFELLAKYFPKRDITFHNNEHGKEYTRDMNMGEFIHFWSGAAKTNLKEQATKAFGWTDQTNKQFEQARKDFPDIKY